MQAAPPLPLTDVMVTPAGTASVTTTLMAFDGPLLESESDQVIGVPATTEAGAVFVKLRSETESTCTDDWALLLLGLGSVESVVTLAKLLKSPPSFEVMW